MNKTEIRDLTYKLLYSLEIQKNVDIDEQIEIYIEENNVEKESIKRYINDIIWGVENNKEEINSIIKSCLDEKWSIERISKINLSILKLSIYEMKYKKIPIKVEINEAVELAKKYGEETSAKFINGALAKVVKEYIEKG